MTSFLQRVGSVVFFGMMVISLAGGCCFGATGWAPAAEASDADASQQPVAIAADDDRPPTLDAPAVDVTAVDAPAVDEPAIDPASLAPDPPALGAAAGALLDRAAFDALSRGRVPQVRGGARLFEDAAPQQGALEGALLVCRTMMTPGHDDWDGPFGGPEIELRARIAGGPLRSTGEGRPAGLFTMPVARLRPRDRVWMRLVDRDVLYDDTIGEGSTRFAGVTPFVVSMRTASIECRAIDGARVARESRPALTRIDRALDRAERARPDVTEPALGYPTSDALVVQREASAAAAWLDWSDPRIEERIARGARFEAAWSRAARDEIARAERELPSTDEAIAIGGGRRAHVAEIACGVAGVRLRGDIGEALAEGPARTPCLARIAIENGSRAWTLPPLTAYADPPLAIEAVDADAHLQTTWWLARRSGDAWTPTADTLEVAPGARVEIVVSLPMRDARLLRIRDERGDVWLARTR